jgi:protein-L-isoaspartate(D-aspartate) O-methyltransferase
MKLLDLNGIGMTSQRTRARLIERLYEQGISDTHVLEVIRTTPRHLFLDEALAHRAYEDASLPIGFNQTLSQPYIVARMSELLLAGGGMRRVLEIGTGSGYQTAVLARLVEQVYSVERIRDLLERARSRFRDLKLANVTTRHADGILGWPAKAPFDGILATAAPKSVPPELVAQLRVGGRLVLPVGADSAQRLHVVTRTESGIETRVVEAVNFVPLVAGIQQ